MFDQPMKNCHCGFRMSLRRKHVEPSMQRPPERDKAVTSDPVCALGRSEWRRDFWHISDAENLC